MKIEITERNNLNIKEGNHRRVINSKQKIDDPFIASVASAFPYIDKDVLGEQVWLLSLGNRISYQMATFSDVDGSIVKEKGLKGDLGCLDCAEGHPEKVQEAAKFLFTDAFKAKFIASLPRVQNAVKSERVRMHKKIHEDGEYVEIVQVEEEITDDGELIPAHLEEVRYDLVPVTLDGAVVMEEYETEEVETFIVYKDKLYPEDWNGDL